MRNLIQHSRFKIVQLLRVSERYTKTDMVYLASGGWWLGLQYVFNALIGILLTVSFANLLPKEAFGTYQFIVSAAIALAAFSLLGMDAAVTRAVAQGNPGALRSGFRTKLRWSAGATLASGALAAYYFAFGDAQIGVGLLVAGALTPFMYSFKIYHSYFFGTRRFRDAVMLGAWRKPLPAIAIITALFLTDDPIVLVGVYFGSHALIRGLLYLTVVRRFRLPVTHDPATLAYGKHLSVMQFFEHMLKNADQVLLFWMLGPAAVAAFAVARLPVEHLHIGLDHLRQLAIPKLAQRDFPTLQRTLPRKVLLILGVSLGIAAAYSIAAPFAFAWLFPLYPESLAWSQALALTIAVAPLSLYSQALIAHEKKKLLYIISIGIPLCRLALLAALIPFFHVWGAVFAVVAAQVAGGGLAWYLFRRHARTR